MVTEKKGLREKPMVEVSAGDDEPASSVRRPLLVGRLGLKVGICLRTETYKYPIAALLGTLKEDFFINNVREI